jgi:acyl-CoA thioester hydrolase
MGDNAITRLDPKLRDYRVTSSASTRWADTDLLGHVNTSVHIQLLDSAINGWLVDEARYDPRGALIIGVVARYDVRYHREIHFPESLVVGLRVSKIGRTSVSYDAALFTTAGPDGEPPRLATEAKAVHVYIDRISRRPVEIPPALREFLHANG